MSKRKPKRFGIALLILFAIAATAFGAWLHSEKPAQTIYYNQAMEQIAADNVDEASESLDKSLQAYQDEVGQNWLHHVIFGRPSDEIAALTHFHQGVLLLNKAAQEQSPGLMGQAVDELMTSLKINPGSPYADNISAKDAVRLNEQAMIVKHDLDLLFQQHPELQNQGAPKPGKGQPGKQAPGNEPGSQPGSGRNDGL